ncbi:MAG: TFIIB-type zinc ribbon-containing protein [Methanobacterium sp.]
MDDVKSAEKVKRHLCLNCRGDKLVKTCPECGSIGLLFDDKRAELSCTDCGTVIECPPPNYVDGVKVVPFSQVIMDNCNVDTNLTLKNRTYRPGLNHWNEAERDVLGDSY